MVGLLAMVVLCITLLCCNGADIRVIFKRGYQSEVVMEQNAISRAAHIAGGQTALARALGCTPQAVQRMCASGRVPAERVLAIETITKVPRHELRPDIYPAPRKRNAA